MKEFREIAGVISEIVQVDKPVEEKSFHALAFSLDTVTQQVENSARLALRVLKMSSTDNDSKQEDKDVAIATVQNHIKTPLMMVELLMIFGVSIAPIISKHLFEPITKAMIANDVDKMKETMSGLDGVMEEIMASLDSVKEQMDENLKTVLKSQNIVSE